MAHYEVITFKMNEDGEYREPETGDLLERVLNHYEEEYDGLDVRQWLVSGEYLNVVFAL